MDLIDTDYPGATIRRRKRNETPLTDSMCTPKWLADKLPIVDIDPASNPRSHIRARWSYSLEKKLDGRKLPWRGAAFLNHPYSNPMPWMLKLNYELSIGRCTSAIVLAKLDCSTEWWQVLTAPIARGYDVNENSLGQASVVGRGPVKIGTASISQHWFTPDIWMFNDRIEFDEPPELIEERRKKVLEKRAAGKKATEKTSNNFCSVIVHHRFGGMRLDLDDVATPWGRL